MRLSRKRRATLAVMDMTPMIDIVFLLLVFFMTVSQVSEINKERLALPQLEGVDEQRRGELTVNVDQEGRLFVGGRQLSMVELVARVTDELQRVDDDPLRLTVVVRADERGRAGPVNELIETLGQLRVTQVRFAVQRP